MNFAPTPEQEQIKAAIERVCAPFDADYWLTKDREGGFPHDFHQALAESGWLGIAMPEAYGGAGLGISEAAHDDAHHLRHPARACRARRPCT
jgi:acyl-CoA dehydrogenase